MNSSGSFDWTPERIERLSFLWITKKSPARVIAQELDPTGKLTRSAVLGKAHRLGLPTRTTGKGYHAPHSPTASKKRWVARPAKEPVDRKALREELMQRHSKTLASLAAEQPAEKPKNWLITDFPDHPGDPKFCRYAVTNTIPYKFCGNATEDQEPWCAAHKKHLTVPGSSRPRLAAKTWESWS